MEKMVDYSDQYLTVLNMAPINTVHPSSDLTNTSGQTLLCVRSAPEGINWIAAAWTPSGTRNLLKIFHLTT
jgi:hypothetical protein